MIDLKALKEQLRLLGHDLPDEQVVAILKDMNIDFNNTPNENSSSSLPLRGFSNREGARDEEPSGVGPPRTGSILDNFQGRGQQHQNNGSAEATAQAAAANYNYGYTSPTHGVAPALDHAKLASRAPPRPTVAHGLERRAEHGPAHDQLASGGYSDDCYDHDSDDEGEEPSISCRYCIAEAGQPPEGGTSSALPRSDIQGTLANRVRMPGQAGGDILLGSDRRGLAKPSHEFSDLSARLGRCDLNDSVVHAGKSSATGAGAARLSVETRTQQPASAMARKDQQHKLHGLCQARLTDRNVLGTLPRRHDEGEQEESDVGPSDTDRDPLQLGGSLQDLQWPPPPAQDTAGSSGRPDPDDPYAAWLRGRGTVQDTRFTEVLLAKGQLSPQASTRSFASRATTHCSTGSKRGAGVKKVDRVQRYQQLQQEWSQNRFLKQASGTSRGTSRKPVNFHSHFASLHAAEEAERQRRLRETRARTKKELGAAIEAPTANRRDELRWQTRMRLREQS